MDGKLFAAGQNVQILQEVIHDGGFNLEKIPAFVKIVISNDDWLYRADITRDHLPNPYVRFDDFEAFVTAPLTEGLNTTIEKLRHFCSSAGDLEAVDMIDRVCQRKDGNPTGVNQHTRAPEPEDETEADEQVREGGTVDNVNGSSDPPKDIRARPTGNSTEQALRKLRTEAVTNPQVAELREAVIAKQKSPHQAMVEAGFRKRYHSLPHDPEKAAAALRRWFDDAELGILLECLRRVIES